jgi:UDP-N-acetylglucosamine--N-acetylmuramyl-(pentapeptide) pyrophosphoryl-undecaprenol N-acetylglucosamine transferase
VVTVLIAGGGSGGHVFPMVAVGDAVRAAAPSAEVVYVGTARGMEARLVPARGDRLELLRVEPLRGGGVRGFLEGAVRAMASLPAARALVARIRPDVVLSVGGYASGPVSLAARIAGVPLALLEPNSILGLANRLLAPLVRRAYVAFPEVEKRFRPSVVMRSGVPLRGAFAAAPYAAVPGRMRVLLLGGSQGAAALNTALPEAIALAVRSAPEVSVIHQTGRDRDEAVRARYAELGIADRATVTAFIDDVAAAIAGADLVVQRAGAGAVAELCAIGRPTLFVPFPVAAVDHQTTNARSLSDVGAALFVAQSEATPLRLAAEIEALARDPARRVRMAEGARARGVPDAAARVAADLLRLAEGRAR